VCVCVCCVACKAQQLQQFRTAPEIQLFCTGLQLEADTLHFLGGGQTVTVDETCASMMM
jgi:hypothetical protein